MTLSTPFNLIALTLYVSKMNMLVIAKIIAEIRIDINSKIAPNNFSLSPIIR